MRKLILTSLCLILASSTALADWDQTEPYKWVQRPDQDGMDIQATRPKILADDFLCWQTSPIGDIHLWGSWKKDNLPMVPDGMGGVMPDPGALSFHLSIHADIPATPDTHSMPGIELWSREFLPGEFTVRPAGTGLQDWFDPNIPEYLTGDHFGIWQYNFEDIVNPFIQQGTMADTIVYWLDVQAYDIAQNTSQDTPQWGWKTSLDHWNDDAVWGDWDPNDAANPPVRWNELIDPMPPNESLDMAFVIAVPEPSTVGLLGIGILTLFRRKRR